MSRKERVRFGRLGEAAVQAFGPLGVRLLVDSPKRSPFSVLLVSIAPGDSHPAILHARTWEFFLVQRGRCAARIDGRRRVMRRGEYAYLPPLTPHEFVAGPRGVEVLVVFSPAMDFSKPDIAACAR